jgi:hypothetical protein
MSGKLSISNFIQVTLLAALRGLADINTSALAFFADEVPIPTGYGDYGIYNGPDGVADDFGASSDTYRIAVAVFSQSPNIMSAGGYLVIIPRKASAPASAATILGTAPVDLTTLKATDYKISLAIDAGSDADITIGSIDTTSLLTATASLNPTALGTAGATIQVTGELTAALITLVSKTAGATSALTVGSAAATDISPLLKLAGSATGAATGTERLKDAILRASGIVPFFGIISTDKPADALFLETAKTVQTMDKLWIVGSATVADIKGVFTTILNSGLTHTRCLYYSTNADDAFDFAAGYASRGLSIDFSGFNTAHTMHGKDIIGTVGDPGMTQTILTDCKNAGVDFYGDFGVPKVFTSGANQFFDQIYSRLAFKLRLTIAGFNFLATTNTKIPQTEEGMNGLKGAYRKICQQFVQAGVFAPGTWNSSTTFGKPEDHLRNISGFGYYIYSLPIATQPQGDRNARKAPATYIACKDAGALHSADVSVMVEA